MEQEDDSVAGITVHESGGVQGVLMNDSDDAVEWARAEYERHRAKATPVPIDAVQ